MIMAAKHVNGWHGPIEGYATNQVTRNLWRVAHTHDRDDMMQEAAMTYLRCAARYPGVEPKHMMALYKTALRHRIDELANKNTRVGAVSCHITDIDDDEGVPLRQQEPVGATDTDGILSIMIKQAPREIAMVLNLFLTAPIELLEMAETAWAKSNRGAKKDDMNSFVRRMLGPEVGDRPVDAVRAYFLDNR